MSRMPKIWGAPLFYLTLLCCVFSLPGAALEIGLISRAGEGVPSYLLKLGEGLVSSTVLEIGGGTLLAGKELQERQDSFREERGEREEAEIDITGCTDLGCAQKLAAELGLAGIALFHLEKSGGGYLVVLEAVSADGTKHGRAEEFFIDIRNYDAGVIEAGRKLAVQMGFATALTADVPDSDSSVPEAEASGETTTAELSEHNEGDVPDNSELSEMTPQKSNILPSAQISSSERLFTTGLTLYQLGGLANMLALMSSAERVSNDYLAQSASLASEQDSYDTAEEFYKTAFTLSSVAAWSLHAAAPVSAGFPLFGSGAADVKFSRRGKWYLYAGLGSAVAGHLLYLDSIDSLVESSYLRAQGQSSSYYNDEYERDFPWIVARQGAILGLWTLGSAAVMAAPAQPGNKESLASNFWDRVLVGSGLALFSGGNVFASLAGISRTDALEDWFDYQESSSPSRYSAWEESFDSFELNRNLAVGLWLSGAFCLALAELADFPDPFAPDGSSSDRNAKKGETPQASLHFLPRPDGGSLYLHVSFQ